MTRNIKSCRREISIEGWRQSMRAWNLRIGILHESNLSRPRVALYMSRNSASTLGRKQITLSLCLSVPYLTLTVTIGCKKCWTRVPTSAWLRFSIKPTKWRRREFTRCWPFDKEQWSSRWTDRCAHQDPWTCRILIVLELLRWLDFFIGLGFSRGVRRYCSAEIQPLIKTVNEFNCQFAHSWNQREVFL